jgi:hypothetical protein
MTSAVPPDGRSVPARRWQHPRHGLRRRCAVAARPGRRDAGGGRDRSPAAICERLSPLFRPERIIARQACFRPVTQDGLPLIGKAGEGAYVATGHSVWGILNAPATGEALSELIVDGAARSTDLTPFDPGRCGHSTRRCCARADRVAAPGGAAKPCRGSRDTSRRGGTGRALASVGHSRSLCLQETHMPRRFLCVIVCLAAALAARAAPAADIKVMISAGFFNVYAELGPAFEKSTGHKLITTRGPSLAIHRRRSRRASHAARKPTS